VAKALVIAAIGLAACARGPRLIDDEKDPVVIGLDRGACYGSCPAYSLVIHASGTVEYIGMSFVKQQGLRRGVLTAARMHDLVAAFDAAGFAALPADLVGNHEDVPHLSLSYRAKSVEYSDGERVRGTREAETVERLAALVERTVRIERWIGTPAERDARSSDWPR
jgi:hypothetical protein